MITVKKDIVTLKIHSLFRDLTDKEKKIANFIIENPNFIKSNSINTISRKLNLADSTFFQFIRKLGYDGMKKFRNDLTFSIENKTSGIHEDIQEKDSNTDIANKIIDSNIQALNDLKLILNSSSFETAFNIINMSRRIHFFGIGGSSIVAYDAYHKFLRSPIDCSYNSDYHIQLMEASKIKEKECAIVISHSGLTKEILEITRLIKENKNNLIVITSYPLSPLAKLADILLISTSKETNYRSEALTSRVSQMSILDALFVCVLFRNGDSSYKSLNSIRNIISRQKKHT